MNQLSTSSRRVVLAAAAVAAVALSACSMMPGMSTMVPMKASMSAAQEVPPNGSPATGTLEANLNKDTNVLTWRMNYSGLTGPATAAHFHGPASMGQNAGVVVPFASAASPSEGQATLTAAQAADLSAGKWYVNVHTAANPGGEIRGQVGIGR